MNISKFDSGCDCSLNWPPFVAMKFQFDLYFHAFLKVFQLEKYTDYFVERLSVIIGAIVLCTDFTVLETDLSTPCSISSHSTLTWHRCLIKWTAFRPLLDTHGYALGEYFCIKISVGSPLVARTVLRTQHVERLRSSHEAGRFGQDLTILHFFGPFLISTLTWFVDFVLHWSPDIDLP